MRKIIVYIEINGEQVKVGEITGTSDNAVFSYAKEYMDKYRPISVSLPFEVEKFNADQTRYFFEGLLLEGFTRKSVADNLRVDEKDYLTLISKLGIDCIGAIRLIEEGSTVENPGYKLLKDDEIKTLASEGARAAAGILVRTHLSLTGASGKVGLYYDEPSDKWYLPVGNAPGTHIIKQSHVRLDNIVLNEQLCMLCAKNLGLDVPESFIVNTKDYHDENILFATKRYDRFTDTNSKILNKKSVPYRCHQEDFAQALGIPSSEKYETIKKNYIGRIFELIRGYSSDPITDQIKLWQYIIFNYLIGNTDAHLKNYSLLYSKDMKTIRLAPLYDVVCTQVYQESTSFLSMYIGEKNEINDIKEDDIRSSAKEAGLGAELALKEYNKLRSKIMLTLKNATQELIDQGIKEIKPVSDRITKSVESRI